MSEKIIYLDNAATSHPKPEGVIPAIVAFMREVGGNAGRSGHRLSIEAGRVVFEAREKVAALFGVRDSSRVVFGQNATEAINLGLKGVLHRGDHVITSSMEHNSVMRPLRALEREGIELTVVPCFRERIFGSRKSPRGHSKKFTPGRPESWIECGWDFVAHKRSRRSLPKHRLLFLVDAAQTAGVIPIERNGMGSIFWPSPDTKLFSALRERGGWLSVNESMKRISNL